MNPAAQWYTDVYRTNYEMALRIARRHLGKGYFDLAEDIVQNVFEDLLKKCDLLMDHPNIAGWINESVVFEVKDEKKKKYHKEETGLLPNFNPISYETESLLLRKKRFYEILPDGLNESEKHILYCSIELELSHEEIGRIIHRSASISRLRLCRAKKHCKKLLEKKRKNPDSVKHFQNPNLYKDKEVQ